MIRNTTDTVLSRAGPCTRRQALQRLAAAGMLAAMPPRTSRAAAAAGEMQTRPIPSSGEQLPVVGLGTWQTFDAGGDAALAPLEEVLRVLYETGGRVVDSSPMYGRSEDVVGTLATRLGITTELFMATKVWTHGRSEGIAQMERSESRMGGSLDLIQVHNLVDLRTHLRTLAEWKAQGRIRYVGITHYTSRMHDELAALVESEPLDFVQFNYNVLERNAEKRLLPAAAAKGVATLINEPFESGSLFRLVRGRELPAWATEIDCTSWAQVFLKFILSHPDVTCAIPATSDPAHMRDNAQAGYGRLPDNEARERIASLMASL